MMGQNQVESRITTHAVPASQAPQIRVGRPGKGSGGTGELSLRMQKEGLNACG